MSLTERARKKKTEPKAAVGLQTALNFIKPATKDEGEIYQQHVLLKDNYAVAFDGIISAGHPIEEDIAACPLASKLRLGLAKCGERLSMTQLDNGRLQLVSSPFRVIVPCVDISDLRYSSPDKNIAPITSNIIDGFKAIGHLPEDGADRVVAASLLLQANTMVSTTGKVILEYYHGIDLPPSLVLPAKFIKAVLASNYNLTGFGYSNSSVTFWFDNNSWIKTVRFAEEYADTNRVFAQIEASNKVELEDSFWEGIKTLAPFADTTSRLYLKPGKMQTHDNEAVGAAYDCFSMKDYGCFNVQDLKANQHVINKIDFTPKQGAYFEGENVRGIMTRFHS